MDMHAKRNQMLPAGVTLKRQRHGQAEGRKRHAMQKQLVRKPGLYFSLHTGKVEAVPSVISG